MSAALSLVTDSTADAKRFTDEKLIPAARLYTDSCNELLDLVVYAYRNDVHVAMGFDQSAAGWQQYLDQNIGGVLAGVKGADRQLAVSTMAEAGMSTRTIAAALKIGKSTVARLTPPVPNGTPAKGATGRGYTKPEPKPEPKPVVDAAELVDLHKLQQEARSMAMNLPWSKYQIRELRRMITEIAAREGVE
ncbi:hypothetical protein [Rhodococcus qingshengii]|uniref:hypothetical protein n=1 Tax=Rhodococcus qingshengii TaxID=334542 RepID=UPI0018785B47|nr:hypothetical protein [Rhodococcus qingshengii]QOS62548.1 hypothetical protein IM699_25070 [Rhodococcus qingshengii]